MKKQFLTLSLSLAAVAFSPLGQAGHPSPRSGGEYYDYARVVQVEPIVRQVRVRIPREECWEEDVPVYQSGYQSATPMILGGIIGGAVGNTMGKGHGKDAATVAGAILGGSIGRDMGQQQQRPSEYRTVRKTRCQQSSDFREEERIEGYHVTYVYNGERYTARMPQDPGQRVRVRVNVQPAW